MGEEHTKHQVTVSDFEIAATELTVHQWFLYSVISGNPMPDPPGWGWNGDNPMVNISWYDCVSYSNWLSQRKGEEATYTLHSYESTIGDADSASWKGRGHSGFRLPTEAEWEYAAGGGSKGRDADGNLRQAYAGSDDLDSVAWYSSNSRSRTQPVGQLKPNELTLSDMSGNVWEWCWDWYGYEYPDGPQTNPTSPIYGGHRVGRGGSWYSDAVHCLVVDRGFWRPRFRYYGIGFRPSRTVSF